MSLFKKALVFTDAHWGRSNNNPVALDDNRDFTDWMIDKAKTEGCDVCIFCGDFFDNRHSIGLNTLHYAMRSLKALNDAFPRLYLIPGNHDLYLRGSRDISSIIVAKNFSNIEILSNPTTIGDVTFLPWLVGDEHKRVKAAKSRYTFAHLEMPGFMMNAKVEMPDSPHAVQPDTFSGQDLVFTGHFHMRQTKGNICYLGNIMPFNFSDAWDADRGMMVLEWGKDPVFHSWPDQPLFRTMRLSDVMADEARYLLPGVTARISLDVDVSFEEAQAIRDIWTKNYSLRKIELVHQQQQIVTETFQEDVIFQTVDQIVEEGLRSVSNKGFSSDKLIQIYRSLPF